VIHLWPIVGFIDALDPRQSGSYALVLGRLWPRTLLRQLPPKMQMHRHPTKPTYRMKVDASLVDWCPH
jgi:hypothetical protein